MKNKVYLIEMMDNRKGYLTMIGKECYGVLYNDLKEETLVQGSITKKGFDLLIDDDINAIAVSTEENTTYYSDASDKEKKLFKLTDMSFYIDDEKEMLSLSEKVMRDFLDIMISYFDEMNGIVKK